MADVKEGTYSERPAKQGGKAKRHCARWWWVYLLAFIAIVLVVVLPVIYVAIPKMAQKEVNKAELVVKVQNVFNPTPESVKLELVTEARSGISYHPTLDPFRASLSAVTPNGAENPPFGYIDIPTQKVESVSTIMINQTLKIVDMAQFTMYNLLVLGTEQFQVSMKGKTGLKLGSLPKYDIDFNKVITMKGLNHLNGFNITSFQLHQPPEADGSVITGRALIPNPSVLTIDMGNVTLNIMSGTQQIGLATLRDLVLRPGDHEYPMRATANVSAILPLVLSGGGKVNVDIVGNSSVANGQVLPYFSKAIQSNTLKATLNLGAALLGGSGGPKPSATASALA